MTIEQKRYAELLVSMTTDFLMNGITWGTFKSNLKMLIKKIEEDNI